MKRTALTLAVLGAAIATVIPLTGAGAQSPGPRTISHVERNKGSISALVDNPPRIRDPAGRRSRSAT